MLPAELGRPDAGRLIPAPRVPSVLIVIFTRLPAVIVTFFAARTVKVRVEDDCDHEPAKEIGPWGKINDNGARGPQSSFAIISSVELQNLPLFGGKHVHVPNRLQKPIPL
jgi:hypothetical protein